MATSVVGHAGIYERHTERSKSPSVEILIDDDENDDYHHKGNRCQQKRFRSVRKRSADVFRQPQDATAKEHGLDHYQRTLNKKYAELKRLVLEAVDFHGKSSEFNRSARQLIQQYSPRRAISPPLRPPVELRATDNFDNRPRKTDRQTAGRTRRHDIDREPDKKERHQSAKESFSGRHGNSISS